MVNSWDARGQRCKDPPHPMRPNKNRMFGVSLFVICVTGSPARAIKNTWAGRFVACVASVVAAHSFLGMTGCAFDRLVLSTL